MASGTSIVTVDTGEWTYVDSYGIGHAVTNGQTFTIYVTDGAAVEYNNIVGQSVTTTDGYVLEFQPIIAGGEDNSDEHTIAPTTDAGQGSAFYSLRGEMSIKCPVSGRVQNWIPATFTPSDADYGSAGTIAATWEDQFGNKMLWKAGMNVGAAT